MCVSTIFDFWSILPVIVIRLDIFFFLEKNLFCCAVTVTFCYIQVKHVHVTHHTKSSSRVNKN